MILKYKDLKNYYKYGHKEIKAKYIDALWMYHVSSIDSKVDELLQIISFVKTLSPDIKNIDDLTFLAFYTFLKHEHDLIFFLENNKNDFVALFNVEIKNNLVQLKKQMKSHLQFFNKRLFNKNVMFFGVLYVPEKNLTKVFTFENDEMVEWPGTLTEIINVLISNNFTFNKKPEKFIFKLDGNFNEKLMLVLEDKIELTSHETNLINSIKESIIKNKIVIVDLNTDLEWIIIPFILYSNIYKQQSEILFLNNDYVEKFKDFLDIKELNKTIFYNKHKALEKINKQNKYIFVLDSIDLTMQDLLELCLIYEKIILFGSRTEKTNKSKLLNLNKLNHELTNIGIDNHLIEYNSSFGITSSKHFDSIIKYLFLPDKIKLDNFKIDKKILLKDNLSDFFKYFEDVNPKKTKHVLAYLDFNNPKYADKRIYDGSTFKKSKITVQNIGLDIELSSVDYLFVLINMDLKRLKKNQFLLNSLIKTCNRAKKELVIYTWNKTDSDELNNKLLGISNFK